MLQFKRGMTNPASTHCGTDLSTCDTLTPWGIQQLVLKFVESVLKINYLLDYFQFSEYTTIKIVHDYCKEYYNMCNCVNVYK